MIFGSANDWLSSMPVVRRVVEIGDESEDSPSKNEDLQPTKKPVQRGYVTRLNDQIDETLMECCDREIRDP